MRSLSAKNILAVAGGLALGGCLVSEEPQLDASNGNATPLDSGAYVMCPVDDEEDAVDCIQLTVSRDGTGLYSFDKEDEDPVNMRFRRIGRRGYAVQSLEDNDEAYLYYYGAGDTRRFRLTMMLCADLPEAKRAQMIDAGDLELYDADFDACTVKTLKGLTTAAKIYHRGEVESDEEIVLELTRAPNVVE